MNFHRVAFLFPGQGSQYVGMGKGVFEGYLEARLILEEAEDLLKRPLKKIMFEGSEEELKQTVNSQVAIFVLSCAYLKVLPPVFPKVCAGLSLGEFTALVAAKKLSFQEALKLVNIRAHAMQQACERTQGTMAVILGLEDEVVEKMVKAHSSELWCANFNCPGQVVISGTMNGVEKGIKEALSLGAKRALPLPVSGAFHSPLMAQAQEIVKEAVAPLVFASSDIELVMNVPGRVSLNIKEDLIAQVTSPVRWSQGITSMQEVDLFIEVGCGKALAGMNRKIGVLAKTISFDKIEDLKTVEEALNG